MYQETQKQAQNNIGKIIKLVFVLIFLVAGALSLGSIGEDVGAGEIVVIQYPVTGTLNVVKEQGFAWQLFGRAQHYKKSTQYWFTASSNNTGETPDEESPKANNSIPIIFNDGGSGSVSGSIRWDMPTDNKSIIRIHSTYGSQEAVENQLIRPTMQKSIYFSGPLMSSKESYAEKKNELFGFIEDQAKEGVYKTRSKELKGIDPLSEKEKTVTVVEILEKNGLKLRQEVSPVKKYGVYVGNLSINQIDYNEVVKKQIDNQQKSTMAVQTAIADAKKAEQEAITSAKQGEAEAAKAKWAQEVIKAKLVTEAQQKLEVAKLEAQAAEETKRKEILLGQGEAERKRLVMNADGALDKRLEAQIRINELWAEAFANYQGSFVPSIQMGGSGSSSNALDFMEMMKIQAAQQMMGNLKNK
jgi:hypothetical protein